MTAETLSHELTHFIEEYAKEDYASLRDAVVEVMFKGDSEKFAERVQHKIEQLPADFKADEAVIEAVIKAYVAQGMSDSEARREAKNDAKNDAAMREVVADACTQMLKSSKAVTELARQNMDLAHKVKDFIDQTVEKIRSTIEKAFSESDPEYYRTEATLILDEMERIQWLWDKGLKAATENYNALQADSKNAAREGGEQYQAFRGYAEDGRGMYESDYELGTPKSAKAADILNYIQTVWSKKPIDLVIWENGSKRKIQAQFDPTYSSEEGVLTDASKLMGGNRHGTSLERRVTLDLASDYYKIASESRYNYSKAEIGKTTDPHKNVRTWHYFVNGIYFAEKGSKYYEPYMVSINVKERADGTFVYSFSAEKERRLTTQGTLHAPVTGKASNGIPSATTITDTSAESNTQEQNQMSDRSTEEIAQDVEAGKEIKPSEEVQFSMAREEDFMDRAEAMNENGKQFVSASTMKKARKIRQLVKQKLTDPALADKLKLPDDIEGNTFLSNSSYGGSEENTTVCVRSLAAQALMDAIAKDIGAPLTIEDTLLISQEIMNFTDKPECVYCYVATDRRAYRQFLGDYIKQRDAALKSLQSGTGEAKAYEEFLAGRKDTKEMKNRFKMWQKYAASGSLIQASDLASIEDLFNEIDTLSKNKNKTDAEKVRLQQLRDAAKYAQSASWAKKMMGYTAYNGHILNWKQSKIDEFNKHYGLRMYSFSDYSPAFVLENMQMVTDAAVKGLKMLAYTKEIEFARIFAPSGMNINVSVLASQDTAHGGIMQDEMMGAKWKEAIELRKQYPNVGITLVATNDAIVEWGLNNPDVDVVIPYHLVRTGQDVAEYFNYKNYTSVSADGKIKGVDYKGKQKSVYPAEHQNDLIKYVNRLQELQLTPRFESYLKGYEQFTAGLISEEQFREMNPTYMKLVNETRQSAEETGTVQPIFDQQAALDSIDTLIKEGGYNKSLLSHLSNNPYVAESILEEITDEVKEARQARVAARGTEQFQNADMESQREKVYNETINTLRERYQNYESDAENLRLAAGAITDLQLSNPREHYSYSENGRRNGEVRDSNGKAEKPASRSGQIRTLGRAISTDIVNNGYVEFRGRTVNSPADVAQMCQCLRDPRFETFRIILTKGNKVVSVRSISSGIPGQTAVTEKGRSIDEEAKKIKSRMSRTGADGYYFVHNHPSGNVTASQEDLISTILYLNGIGRQEYKGHIILDHDHFGLIEDIPVRNSNGVVVPKSSIIALPGHPAIDFLHQHSVEHPLLDSPAINAGQIASLGKQIQTSDDVSVLLYCNSDRKVVEIQEVLNKTFLNNTEFANYIKNQLIESGANDVALYTTSKDVFQHSAGLVKSGHLVDTVYNSAKQGEIPKYDVMRRYVNPAGFDFAGKNLADYKQRLYEQNTAYNQDSLQFQMADITADDTAAESEGRQKAWNDLKAENEILREATERLNREIAKLTKRNDKLGRELKRTTTPEIRLNDAKKLAREIVAMTQREAVTTRDKQYNREMADELAERIKGVADYMVQAGDSIDYDKVTEMAYEIAHDIVSNAEAEIDDGGATKDMREQMRAALKGRAIFVPENVRADTLDWNAFKKQYRDIFTFRDNGLDIDIVYENLLQEVPGLLDPNINNPGDMLNEMAEKWDLLQPKYENPYEQYENEATSHYMNMIIESVLEGRLRQVAPTYADRMNDRIARLRGEKREAVKAASRFRSSNSLSGQSFFHIVQSGRVVYNPL